MFNNGKVRALEESIENLEAQVSQCQEHHALLKRELGTDNPNDIIAMVRRLEGQVTSLQGQVTSLEGQVEDLNNRQAEMAAASEAEEDDATSLANLGDPRAVLTKIRTFTNKIESLNGTVASMEEQLMSLYEDKERLEREIGASEVEDVLEAFRGLENTISSMETQLMTMYASREMLEVELGFSDPREIVTRFRNIARMVTSVHQDLNHIIEQQEAEHMGIAVNGAHSENGYAPVAV
ncbi:MAG: hypothetical protein OHK0029_28880 [Armatimonadaceae bacterium]